MSDPTPGCSPEEIRNEFIAEEGRLNAGVITDNIRFTNPYLMVCQAQKKPWKKGVGDEFTTTILTNVTADPGEGEGWEKYGMGNACCWKPSLIDYGSKKQTSHLEKYSKKTKDFCIPELQFHFQIQDQISQLGQILTQTSQDIWYYWLRASTVANSQCVSLNKTFGFPSQQGVFPKVEPSSALDYDLLNQIVRQKLRPVGAFNSPAIVDGGTKYLLVICSQETYDAIEASYVAKHVARGLNASIKEIQIPALGGNLMKMGNYCFLIDETPRRYEFKNGDFAGPIPHMLKVKSHQGYEDMANDEYWTLSQIEETVVYNAEAWDWLVPSEFTAMGVDIEAYAGIFKLVNIATIDDPDAELAHFLAKFIAGAHAMKPQRSMTIRHLVPHLNAAEVGVTRQSYTPSDPPIAIVNVVPRLESNQMQVEIRSALPEFCEVGTVLSLVTQQGSTAAIANVVATDTSGVNPVYVLELAPGEGNADIAKPRKHDPWVEIRCVPDYSVKAPPLEGEDAPDFTLTLGDSDIVKTVNYDGDEVEFVSTADAETVDLSDQSDMDDFLGELNEWLAGNGTATGDISGPSVTITDTNIDASLLVFVDGDDANKTFVAS